LSGRAFIWDCRSIKKGVTYLNSLHTLQKTFRVFQILSKVAMILFFVWAGLTALGLLWGIALLLVSLGFRYGAELEGKSEAGCLDAAVSNTCVQ